MVQATPFVQYAMATMAVVPVLVLLAVVQRSLSNRAALVGLAAVASWFGLTGWAAWSGQLHGWHQRPPALVPFLVAATVAVLLISLSRIGPRLAHNTALWALVGLQVFRLPLELVMHHAAQQGAMPPQMSYGGLNYDVLTGLSALVLAVLLYRRPLPRRLLAAWNLVGALLLSIIVVVAMASTPTFALFGAHRLNTWIAEFPFVWLPTVNVPLALFVHLLLWRRLREVDTKY